MDSFLFYGDYAKQIQQDNLSQITGGNQTILESIQRAAIEECVSYLKQKYDISQAFQAVSQHDPSKTYNAGQTVYLNATAYDATKTYALGVRVLQGGFVYLCSTAITTSEAFNASHWTKLGTQYDLYYAGFPKDVFNLKTIYKIGDQVFYKNKVYTCLVRTSILDHASQLQIGVAGVSSVVNVFPDDISKGAQNWVAGTDYMVEANTALTDSKWIQGDNRDQKLLMICIDIALFHAHSRISPNNIPDLRTYRYIGHPEDREVRGQRVIYPTYSALGWLQAAAIGSDITPELPLIQPESGKRIRFGGNMKNINNY
jgi:hypothetical protein